MHLICYGLDSRLYHLLGTEGVDTDLTERKLHRQCHVENEQIRILVLTLATTLAHNLWGVALPKWGSLFICKHVGWMRVSVTSLKIEFKLCIMVHSKASTASHLQHLQFHRFSFPCSFTKFQLHQSSSWSSSESMYLLFPLLWLFCAFHMIGSFSTILSCPFLKVFPKPYYLKIIGPVSHFHGLFSLTVLSRASLVVHS